MLLHGRSIGLTAAVVGFFALSIVGAVEGLAPYTCARRALLGAVITYLAALAAAWTIDAILTQAMIASQVNKDNAGDDEN